MKRIIEKLEQKVGIPGLIDRISTDLSGSELNTFLLALFKKRVTQITPSGLLRQYGQNRFSMPASIDPIDYKEDEILWLKSASLCGFKPILLAPLTPLGTSSAIGYVDQNNVVSALRGSEVVSDATNVLALKVANEIRHEKKIAIKKYATTHRHVRGQNYADPTFTAHFGAFCMVSGGISPRSRAFEVDLAKEHISFYINMLSSRFAKDDLSVELYLADTPDQISSQTGDEIEQICQDSGLAFRTKRLGIQYYKILQFKIFLNYQKNLLDLADGGFVDWTQKLLENKKQRLFISGVGLEIIYKIRQAML